MEVVGAIGGLLLVGVVLVTAWTPVLDVATSPRPRPRHAHRKSSLLREVFDFVLFLVLSAIVILVLSLDGIAL